MISPYISSVAHEPSGILKERTQLNSIGMGHFQFTKNSILNLSTYFTE
jgi:hypothetical protein